MSTKDFSCLLPRVGAAALGPMTAMASPYQIQIDLPQGLSFYELRALEEELALKKVQLVGRRLPHYPMPERQMPLLPRHHD